MDHIPRELRQYLLACRTEFEGRKIESQYLVYADAYDQDEGIRKAVDAELKLRLAEEIVKILDPKVVKYD